jgi:hypothetical protein
VLYRIVFSFSGCELAPGQTAFVGAFDKATGKAIWA